MKNLETIKTNLLIEFTGLLNSYINPSKVVKALRTETEKAEIKGKLEGFEYALLTVGVPQSKINRIIDQAHAKKAAN